MVNEPWRVELSIPTGSCNQNIEEQIASSLKEIPETSHILRALKRDGVDWKWITDSCDDLDLESKQQSLCHEKYETKIRDFLQRNLHLSINLQDKEVRSKEIADVLFYILFCDDHPPHAQDILSRIYKPLAEIRYTWYELACGIIEEERMFHHFYRRLGNRHDSLECLTFKHKELLFNKQSYLLICRLDKVLPYETLLYILKSEKRRSKIGQTQLFYAGSFKLYVRIFRDHAADLYELLSIQDDNGQTALFMNRSSRMPRFTETVLRIIMDVYKPKHLKQLLFLLNIKDNESRTALDRAKGSYICEILTWLNNELMSNHYPLHKRPIVLIGYTTTRRPGAKDEAQTISDAFISRQYSRIRLKKDFKEDDIITVIQKLSKLLSSALIVVLLSHGGVGCIYDNDGQPIKLTDIESAMCDGTAMKEKPKILITQSCNFQDEPKFSESGGEKVTQQDDSTPEVNRVAYVPTNPHFCAIMSSVSGEESTRNRFIPELGTQIRNCKENHDINKLVQLASKEMKNKGSNQTPIVSSTLKAKFCLGNESPYIEWTDKETDISMIDLSGAS